VKHRRVIEETTPSSVFTVVSKILCMKFKYAADLQSTVERHATGSRKTNFNDSVPYISAISYSGHVPHLGLLDRQISTHAALLFHSD